MDVTFQLNLLQSSQLTTLHLIFPNALPPYNSTNVLKLNESIPFKLYGSDVFGMVHVYNADQSKLVQRFMFIPVFNVPTKLNYNNISYQINTAKTNGPLTLAANANDLNAIEKTLEQYITNQYNYVQSLNPCNEILRRKHSLFWDLNMNNGASIKIPYATLAMKGNNALQNISHEHINNMRSMFLKKIYNHFKLIGKNPTDFTRQSLHAYRSNDGVHKHAVMMQIADFFSSFIHSIVQYKTDYNATGKMDYVGMNSFNGTLVADCEDQATAAYNVIRLFRTIFGSRMNDVLHPATTIGYHFGAWLNDADVALFQGSVQPEKNQPQINHVWCAILSKHSPFVFVEATASSADYSKYKYLVHAWMWKQDQLFDLFFVNPHNHTYGLPLADLVYKSNTSNAYDIFEHWADNRMRPEYQKQMLFAGHINTETYNIFDKVI